MEVGNNQLMNIEYKHCATLLVSFALANWSSCFQSPCRGAEQTPANLAERIRVLGAEDHGLLAIDQAPNFTTSILGQTASAGLMVATISKVTSNTNGSFVELRRNLAVEATEPQLLDFLGKVALSNSTLRVRSLAVRPTADRSRLN